MCRGRAVEANVNRHIIPIPSTTCLGVKAKPVFLSTGVPSAQIHQHSTSLESSTNTHFLQIYFISFPAIKPVSIEAEHIMPAVGYIRTNGRRLRQGAKTHCEARAGVSDRLWAGQPTIPIVHEVCTEADLAEKRQVCAGRHR